MKLYLAGGRYVGTQAEARGLDRGFTQVDVPTDKEGLVDYLNSLTRGMADSIAPRAEAEEIDDLLAPEGAPVFAPDALEFVKGAVDRVVDRAMAQCDVEEAIQRADMRELASYASNVAWRFQEIGR